jgi:hypothetical protein
MRVTEVRPEGLIAPLAGCDGWRHDLGVPPGRLRLGQAAQAVAGDAEQSLDGDRVEARHDLERDELGVGQLAVANAIVGQRRSGAGSFADEHQQVDGHAGPLRELRERDAAERREPLVGRVIEEVERDLAALDRGAEAVQRDARRRQAVDQPRAAHITRRQPVLGVRREDAQVDQPAQLIDADPGPLGRFGDLVPLHEPYCRAERPLVAPQVIPSRAGDGPRGRHARPSGPR